jgi:Holliday junction resolvase RusA-like endonuclease
MGMETIMNKPINIIFSLPPSVNSCWRNFKGRVILSEKYRQWRSENNHFGENSTKKIIPIKEPVDVLMVVRPGKGWRKCDLDNRIKPILDQLQHCGYILGDDTDCIKSIYIRLGDRADDDFHSYVEITISPYEKEEL